MKEKYEGAFFCGDFNPFHFGHIHVMAKASPYVQRIVLAVTYIAPDRAATITPPILDRQDRYDLVRRYLDEGYLDDIEVALELDSFGSMEEFFQHIRERGYAGIAGTDIFNYNRWPEDHVCYRKFKYFVEFFTSGLIVVERPGFPPDQGILGDFAQRGYDVTVVKGACESAAREIRRRITEGESITGLVPTPLERDIVTMYEGIRTDSFRRALRQGADCPRPE